MWTRGLAIGSFILAVSSAPSQAAVFSFYGDETRPYGEVSASAEYDPVSHQGSVSVSVMNDGFTSIPPADYQLHFDVYDASASIDSAGMYNVFLSGAGSFNGFNSGIFTGNIFQVSFSGIYDPSLAVNYGYLSGPFPGLLYGSFTYGGQFSLVPLPASAPNFGTALLALGAVGYGMKRKKTATA